MTGKDKISYRGATMDANWPEQIQRAQKLPVCFVNGREIPRIRYGTEPDVAAATPCGECGVIKGELHVEGCRLEACAGCGAPRFSCDCEPYEDT